MLKDVGMAVPKIRETRTVRQGMMAYCPKYVQNVLQAPLQRPRSKELHINNTG